MRVDLDCNNINNIKHLTIMHPSLRDAQSQRQTSTRLLDNHNHFHNFLNHPIYLEFLNADLMYTNTDFFIGNDKKGYRVGYHDSQENILIGDCEKRNSNDVDYHVSWRLLTFERVSPSFFSAFVFS